jgi:hypothetical protein
MSQSPGVKIGALSPINMSSTGPFSPQKTMGHNGFFNENNSRRWAESRKSMVTARYEKEITVRMEFEEKQKKMEKLLKDHKKMIKESVKTEVRAKETERLEEIGENRRKAEF